MADNKQTLHGQGPQMSGQEAIHTLLQRLSELSVHQHRLVVTFDHLRTVVEKIIERFSRFSFLLAMQGGARNLLPYGLHNMLGGGGGSHGGGSSRGPGGGGGGGGGGGSGPFDFAKALKDALDYNASKNFGKQELDYRGHLVGKARKAAFKMGTPLDEGQVLQMMGTGDIKDLQAFVKTLEETAYHRPDEQARASLKDNTAAIRRIIKEAIKGSGVDIDASALKDIVSQLADKVIKGFAEQKEVTKAKLSAKVDQGALDLHDNVVMIDTETVGLGSRGVSPDAISVSATTVGEDGRYQSSSLFLPMEKEVEELHEALKKPDFAPADEKQQVLFNTLEETARILGHTVAGSEDRVNNYKISGMEKGLGDPKALLDWWRAALDKQSPEAQKAFVDFTREAFSTKALGAHNLPFDRGVLLKILKKLGAEDVNLPSDETGTERAVDTAAAVKVGDKKSNLNELIKVAGGIAAVTKWLEEHGAPKKLVEAVANRENVHDAEADAAATLASLHLLRTKQTPPPAAPAPEEVKEAVSGGKKRSQEEASRLREQKKEDLREQKASLENDLANVEFNRTSKMGTSKLRKYPEALNRYEASLKKQLEEVESAIRAVDEAKEEVVTELLHSPYMDGSDETALRPIVTPVSSEGGSSSPPTPPQPPEAPPGDAGGGGSGDDGGGKKRKNRWRNIDNARDGGVGPLADFMGYLKGNRLPDSAEDGLNKALQPQKKWFTWFGNTQKQSDAAKKNFTEVLKKVSEKGLLGVAAGAAKGAMPLAATMGSQMLSAGNPVAFQTLMDSFALLAGRLSMMLLPTVMTLIDWLQGLANTIQELSPGTKELIGNVVWGAAALGGFVIVVGALQKVVLATTAALAVFGLKLRHFNPGGGGVGGAIGKAGVIGAAIYGLYEMVNWRKEAIEESIPKQFSDNEDKGATRNKDLDSVTSDPRIREMIANKDVEGLRAEAAKSRKEAREEIDHSNMRSRRANQNLASSLFFGDTAFQTTDKEANATKRASILSVVAQQIKDGVGGDLKKNMFGKEGKSNIEKRDEYKALAEKQKELEKQKGMLLSLRAMAASPQYSDIGNAYKKVQLDVLSKDPMLLALEKMQREGLEKMIALQQEGNQHLQSISGEAKRTVAIDKK